MSKNWIAIYDASKHGKVVYVSDSITDCTDFQPEEIIGRTAYSLFHPDDTEDMRKVHASNVLTESMSSMTTYRHLCKDGTYLLTETIVIYCYDLLLACHYVYEETSLQHKMRVSAIDEWYFCLPNNGPVQKVASWRVHRDPQYTRDQVWINETKIIKTQEKRVCLVLNRYTDDLDIVYASKLAPELLGLDLKTCLGRSIYDYLPEIDCMALQAQVDIAKRCDRMFRLRADWIIDHVKGVSEQVEGITCCTDDGLVMVLRLAPRVFLKL